MNKVSKPPRRSRVSDTESRQSFQSTAIATSSCTDILTTRIDAQGAGLLTHTMPGRVKHHHHPTIPNAQRGFRKNLARMAQSNTPFLQLNSQSKPTPSKEAIVWISILSVIVVATLIIVSILICRCTCSRKKRAARKRNRAGHSHHASLEVTDGRNDHWTWNRHAPFGPVDREWTDASGCMLTPLSKAAVRPAGSQFTVHPGEPVVVDDKVDPLTPVYAKNKGSRYYSGIQSAWKRVSQIGRAC